MQGGRKWRESYQDAVILITVPFPWTHHFKDPASAQIWIDRGREGGLEATSGLRLGRWNGGETGGMGSDLLQG